MPMKNGGNVYSRRFSLLMLAPLPVCPPDPLARVHTLYIHCIFIVYSIVYAVILVWQSDIPQGKFATTNNLHEALGRNYSFMLLLLEELLKEPKPVPIQIWSGIN